MKILSPLFYNFSTMIKSKILSVLAVSVLLVGGTVAFAEEIIIFEQTDGSRAYWLTSDWGQTTFAQTFISPTNGAIKKVEMPGCGSFKIHFYELENAFAAPNFPNGPALASFSANYFCSWNGFATALEIPSSGPMLKAGGAYAMVVESSNAFIFSSDRSATQDAYPAGTLMIYKNSQWSAMTGNDLAARIWDDPLPVVKNISIDVKPGSEENVVNLKSKGIIPVALLSAADFDAPAEVDRNSLSFGVTGDEKSRRSCGDPEDVNGDGLPDLVCHFETSLLGLQNDTQSIVLKGKTASGLPIEGKNSVKVIK